MNYSYYLQFEENDIFLILKSYNILISLYFFSTFELTKTDLVNLGGANFPQTPRRSKLVKSHR